MSYSMELKVRRTCPSLFEFPSVYPLFVFVHSGKQFWKLLNCLPESLYFVGDMSLKTFPSSSLRSHKTLSPNKQTNIFSFIQTPKRTCIQIPPRFLLYGRLQHLKPCVPFISSSGSLQEYGHFNYNLVLASLKQPTITRPNNTSTLSTYRREILNGGIH